MSDRRVIEIDIYPVGVLRDVQYAVAALRHGHRGEARRRLRMMLRYLAGQARKGKWRAVRQAFNGYLAEPDPIPEGLARCGRGWTKRAALRSLHRRMRTAGIRYEHAAIRGDDVALGLLDANERMGAALARVRESVHIADAEDVTDWQRGYRACAARVHEALKGSDQ